MVVFFQSFASIVSAKDAIIDDLLNPETSSVSKNPELNKELAPESEEKSNIDDLLGPKDIFPFLPDNHRDSGTGKFNSF